MRKSLRIGLTLVAACALVGCAGSNGSNNAGGSNTSTGTSTPDVPEAPMEKAQAITKIMEAGEGIKDAHAVKVEGTFGYRASSESKVNDYKMVSDSTYTIDGAVILDNKDGYEAGVKIDTTNRQELTEDSVTRTGTQTMNMEMYMDVENYYLKTDSLTVIEGRDPMDPVTTYAVMTIDQLKATITDSYGTIFGMLEGLIGGGDSTEDGTSAGEEEGPGMLDVIMAILPNPTYKKVGNTETISLTLTNDILTPIGQLLAPIFMPTDGIEDEEVIAMYYQAFVDQLLAMVVINECTISIDILDGSVISGVEADIDVIYNSIEEDGSISSVANFVLGVDASLSVLANDYAIAYPADLDEWASRMSSNPDID